jgi:hypothetical protein
MDNVLVLSSPRTASRGGALIMQPDKVSPKRS